MIRSEGNMSLKNPVIPPGIDPGTFRLVAQRLNHYATPGMKYLYYCLIRMNIVPPFLPEKFFQIYPNYSLFLHLHFLILSSCYEMKFWALSKSERLFGQISFGINFCKHYATAVSSGKKDTLEIHKERLDAI